MILSVSYCNCFLTVCAMDTELSLRSCRMYDLGILQPMTGMIKEADSTLKNQ